WAPFRGARPIPRRAPSPRPTFPRTPVDIRSVCIVGGSGFLGANVAELLSARGIAVRGVTRHRRTAMPLAGLPVVGRSVADARETASLARAFENMDAVVNLVGILHPSRRATFNSAHVDLASRIVEACHSAGVQHLVHVSALGASESAPSEYLRSKA